MSRIEFNFINGTKTNEIGHVIKNNNAESSFIFVNSGDSLTDNKMKIYSNKGRKLNNEEKEISAEILMKKYKNIWKNSNLGLDFYKKLFDIIPRLNLKVKEFNSKLYNSVEEQIADRLLILFANESMLNSKTVSKGSHYGGLFQLANASINAVKKWAKENPDKISPKINKNFKTSAEFAKNVNASDQLEWLVAYIGSKGELNTDMTVDELARIVKSSKSLANTTNTLNKTAYKNNVKLGTKNL